MSAGIGVLRPIRRRSESIAETRSATVGVSTPSCAVTAAVGAASSAAKAKMINRFTEGLLRVRERRIGESVRRDDDAAEIWCAYHIVRSRPAGGCTGPGMQKGGSPDSRAPAFLL